MSELEKYVDLHREGLDDAEPRPGHEARFMHKLEKQGRTRKLNFRHGLQIAASVAIILASSIVLVQQRKGGSKIAMENATPAFEEADRYYAMKVNERVEQISAFEFESIEEKNLLLEELQDLDQLHAQLISDLEANPGDERVINALVRHYQLKLEVMDQIIEQLNQLQTESNEQDENDYV